jgi:hypothetical protein
VTGMGALKKAVRLVQELGVLPLFRRLMEFEDDLANPAHISSYDNQHI